MVALGGQVQANLMGVQATYDTTSVTQNQGFFPPSDSFQTARRTAKYKMSRRNLQADGDSSQLCPSSCS